MYAQLGTTIFDGLKGFASFDKSVEASLVEHALIDGKPRLQKTGTALDTIEFSMLLHDEFCVPETEISTLEAACAAGEVLPLLKGTGELVGNFVLRSVRHTVTQTAADGKIIECEVSVSLVEQAYKSTTARTGFAASAGNGEPVTRLPSRPFPAATITAEVMSATAKAAIIQTSAERAQVSAGQAQKSFRDVKSTANSMQRNIERAKEAIASARRIYDKTRVLESNLNTMLLTVNRIKDVANAEDASGLLAASNQLTQQAGLAASSASVIAGIAAFRKPS